ncbi:MAG: META domain-containing protein [Rhodobacteraceae bacterium]|nr:META domain-containing protein [Paracoccaceae bacterium]
MPFHHLKAVMVSGFMLLAPLPALSEADGPDFFRVVNVSSDDVLNIRADSNSDSAIIGTIPPGAQGVRNLGCVGGMTFAEYDAATDAERAAGALRGWCNVEYDGVTGWASQKYLREGSVPNTDMTNADTDEAIPTWNVVSLNGETPVGEAYLSFSPDGNLSGFTGCNNFSAYVSSSNGQLFVDTPFIMTMMACAGDDLAAQETALVILLESQPTYTFDPILSQMTLISANGEIWAKIQRN